MTNSRTERRMARSALANAHAAIDTAATLGVRVPLFAQGLTAPSVATALEWNRAVSEKVMAGFEGAMAASFAWQTFWIRAAFRMPGAATFAHAFTDAAEKAARPARRKVAANARRLTRR